MFLRYLCQTKTRKNKKFKKRKTKQWGEEQTGSKLNEELKGEKAPKTSEYNNTRAFFRAD